MTMTTTSKRLGGGCDGSFLQGSGVRIMRAEVLLTEVIEAFHWYSMWVHELVEGEQLKKKEEDNHSENLALRCE